MPDFLPVLAVGLIVLIIGFAVYAFPFDSFKSPSGFLTAGTGRYGNSKYIHIPLVDMNTISMKTYPVTEIEGTVTSEEETIIFTFKAEPEIYKTGIIEFLITDTNNYGKISFILNNEEIYSGQPEIGRHWKRFGSNIIKEDNILVAKVTSPGLRFWSETKYDFKIKILGAIESKFKKTFILENPKNPKLLFNFNFKRGNMIIEFNDERIYEGDMEEERIYLDEELFQEKNTIEVSSSPGSRFDIDWAELISGR